MLTDDTLCIVNVPFAEIYDFCDDNSAEDALNLANNRRGEMIDSYNSRIVDYPQSSDYWKQCLKRSVDSAYSIMTYAEFQEMQRKHLLGGDLVEITEERFYEMLEVIPPFRWTTRKNVEMFCMLEMYTGSYTDQYAHDHNTGKFYTKMVDAADSRTWISEILYPNKNKEA